MSKQTITLPAFGSAIAGQGGFFAAIMRGATVDGVQQPAEALLVSDIALEIEAVEWGKYGQDVTGATSRTDGKANTDAMVAANCPAALRVREFCLHLWEPIGIEIPRPPDFLVGVKEMGVMV